MCIPASIFTLHANSQVDTDSNAVLRVSFLDIPLGPISLVPKKPNYRMQMNPFVVIFLGVIFYFDSGLYLNDQVY